MARRDQCPGRYLSLAGFEVTIIGRFWVTAEANKSPNRHNDSLKDF
jgi:hypothetical protein